MNGKKLCQSTFELVKKLKRTEIGNSMKRKHIYQSIVKQTDMEIL